MQTYDFLMLFVLVGLTLYGYAKGMAWQVAYIVSFFASYFVAVKFSGRLAPVFGDAAPWNKFMAMAAIYAGFSLVTWLAFRVVKGAINKVKLQSFDRQMGAFVGAARGALWCLGITFVAVMVLPSHFEGVKQHVVGSVSGRQIARLLDRADALMPPEVHQVLGPRLAALKNELQPSAGVSAAETPPVGRAIWGADAARAPTPQPPPFSRAAPARGPDGFPADPRPLFPLDR